MTCTMCYLDRRLVQMTQVRCGLSWFMTQHHHVGIDQSEGINNNLKRTGATQERSLDSHLLFLIQFRLEIDSYP